MNDHLLEALEQVLGWNLPDENIADAVNAQARLMAGGLDHYEDNTIINSH